MSDRAGRPLLLPLLRRRGPGTEGASRRRMALPQSAHALSSYVCRNRSAHCEPRRHARPGAARTPWRTLEQMRTSPNRPPRNWRTRRPKRSFAGRSDTFGDRICVTSSMTDAVIIHLAAAVQPGIDVRVPRHRLPLRRDDRHQGRGARPSTRSTLINVTPSRTVAEQDAELGPRLYGRNPDLCCYLRKVEPLERALEPLRRLDHRGAPGRDRTPPPTPRSWSGTTGGQMVKVNPIASWTQEQVDDYIDRARRAGEPAASTTGTRRSAARPAPIRVEPGADPRSGRWAGTGKTECGIHAC